MEFIKEWGLIAGIGGLGLGVFLVLFREVIRKKIFPMLTKSQGFQIIIVFMLLVWSIAAFSMYIYFSQPNKDDIKVGELSRETWRTKKKVYLELIDLVGKISANSKRTSELEKLKPEFDQFYKGSMVFAEENERELLKRMMILNKDYENTLENKSDYYKPEKLTESCTKLIKQLNIVIDKGDKEN